MSKIARTIGVYTFTIAEDGALMIEATHLPGPLTFEASQVQELQGWLAQWKDQSAQSTSAVQETAVPVESSEDIVGQVISEAIAQARESYPAGLDIENRDRFIDQIARDPLVKPLVGQGKISRKQIMLEIEQRLNSGAPSLWLRDQGRRKSR